MGFESLRVVIATTGCVGSPVSTVVAETCPSQRILAGLVTKGLILVVGNAN